MGALWTLISDPERFLIDHWPSVAVLVFLFTLPFMFREYLLLIQNRVVQVIVLCVLLIAGSWSVRGRWDSDQFAKERASFQSTLDKINAENMQATLTAQRRVEADAKTNREVLAKAIADAAEKTGAEKGRADTLQSAIDRMPDVDAPIAPTKDCPKPPPRVIDPTLKRILGGK